MRIELSGKAKKLAFAAAFIALVGIGILFDKISDDYFVVTPKESGAGFKAENNASGAGGEAVSNENNDNGNVLRAMPQENTTNTETAAAEDNSATSDNSPNDAVRDGVININTADVNVLDKLDGIGESTAKKIIAYREENGEFENVEELLLVGGIGEKKLEAIRDKICVKWN